MENKKKKVIIIVLICIVILLIGFLSFYMIKQKNKDTLNNETSVIENANILGFYYKENGSSIDPAFSFLENNKVEYGGNRCCYGTFEVKGNKVYITFTNALDVSCNPVDVLALVDSETLELEIIDDNTLKLNDDIYIKNNNIQDDLEETSYTTYNIIGHYIQKDASSDEPSFNFVDEINVIYGGNDTNYGTYNIIDNVITITFTKSLDPTGNIIPTISPIKVEYINNNLLKYNNIEYVKNDNSNTNNEDEVQTVSKLTGDFKANNNSGDGYSFVFYGSDNVNYVGNNCCFGTYTIDGDSLVMNFTSATDSDGNSIDVNSIIKNSTLNAKIQDSNSIIYKNEEYTKTKNTKNYTISGHYNLVNANGDEPSFTFNNDGSVEFSGLWSCYGTFNIVDNTIYIDFTNAKDPDGDSISPDSVLDSSSMELLITSNNVLENKDSKYIKQ